MSGRTWRKRKHGTRNQIGKAFPIKTGSPYMRHLGRPMVVPKQWKQLRRPEMTEEEFRRSLYKDDGKTRPIIIVNESEKPKEPEEPQDVIELEDEEVPKQEEQKKPEKKGLASIMDTLKEIGSGISSAVSKVFNSPPRLPRSEE